MTNPESAPKSHFGKPSEVDIKDVDDSNVQWGNDAKAVADEAGLGAYGPDAQGEPHLGEDVAEQALFAMEEQVRRRDDAAALRFEVGVHRGLVGALVLSALAQWLLHYGVL